MKPSKKYRDLASTMRKTAKDMTELRDKKNKEKMEKCAATIVAKVGLEELKKLLNIHY